MSSEMVKRVADAIEWQMSLDDNNSDDLARAAIKAMREPTCEMVAAANRNNHPRDVDTWRTMIDATLE